ncbi:MAG: hypothetical protein ACK5TK_05360 [Betaproteobacteria bacterium]
MTHWLPSPAPVARCTSAGGVRGSARRLWQGRLAPPVGLATLAGQAADDAPQASGRVHGGGSFAQAGALAALQQALPAALVAALRPNFEWYVCRGAFFHTDAHYGEVLFGAWCVLGPARELVFPRLGLRLPAQAGDCAVFDPFEPHAVLAPGAAAYEGDAYAGTAPSVFLGFEIALTDAVRAAFGIGGAPAEGPELSSRAAVNAETGELQ